MMCHTQSPPARKRTSLSSTLVWALAALGLLLCAGSLGAQDAGGEDPQPFATGGVRPLPRGFDTIILGQDFDTAEKVMRENPGLDYRGRPEVSLALGSDDRIIETMGGRYIQRGVFQFHQRLLFAITLMFEPRYLDYYLLFSRLGAKYGPPDSLDPLSCRWEDERTLIILEKPQTLKYLDKARLTALLDEGRIEASTQEESLENFIQRL